MYILSICPRDFLCSWDIYWMHRYQEANWVIHRSYQIMFLHFFFAKEIIFCGQTSCTFFPYVPGTSISLIGHKMLVNWALRLPNMFLSHNIVFKGKNQAKVMYFMKLAILIFGCPRDMHITNFTRMPQELIVRSYHLKNPWCIRHITWKMWML